MKIFLILISLNFAFSNVELSFSGGGLRSAFYTNRVLNKLDPPENIILSGVSGGSWGVEAWVSRTELGLKSGYSLVNEIKKLSESCSNIISKLCVANFDYISGSESYGSLNDCLSASNTDCERWGGCDQLICSRIGCTEVKSLFKTDRDSFCFSKCSVSLLTLWWNSDCLSSLSRRDAMVPSWNKYVKTILPDGVERKNMRRYHFIAYNEDNPNNYDICYKIFNGEISYNCEHSKIADTFSTPSLTVGSYAIMVDTRLVGLPMNLNPLRLSRVGGITKNIGGLDYILNQISDAGFKQNFPTLNNNVKTQIIFNFGFDEDDSEIHKWSNKYCCSSVKNEIGWIELNCKTTKVIFITPILEGQRIMLLWPTSVLTLIDKEILVATQLYSDWFTSEFIEKLKIEMN